MVDLSRDFWLRKNGTGQQVTQLHERYMLLLMMMMMMQNAKHFYYKSLF